ncbi:MAG TPA: bacillithiol biosynthesis cysteine-adding enzyme BshC, partial [Candidatus Kapabacteria bacterium]|nr:bacillithiol biosynthesis cysteine-adding enzyme BshC [Candidatus Kapabacteria bacterium]
LEKIELSNTLTVTTGQQVGFLGGPLYTFLKISSTINFSQKLSEKHIDYNFVPIFWIEDNDHDNLEASQAVLLDKSYNLNHFFCSDDLSKEDNTPVSEKFFNKSIRATIQNISSVLKDLPFFNEIKENIEEFYQEGSFWTEAFVKLLQDFFAESGILFLRASVARKSGAFADIIKKELSEIGFSHKIIENGNSKLLENGYKLQARSFISNLFYHQGNNRYKIRLNADLNTFQIDDNNYSLKELQDLSEKHPENFSPGVLLRNICQDYILPNVAYIGGPSELSYSAQLPELYSAFKIDMPAFIPRHLASFLNLNLLRKIEKYNLNPSFFMRNWVNVEKEIKQQLSNNQVISELNSISENLEQKFEVLKKDIGEIDSSLVNSSGVALHQIQKSIDDLKKKTQNAILKKSELINDTYKKISNFLYPESTFQERMISPLYFACIYGKENFILLLNEIAKEDEICHQVVCQDD